MHLYQLHQFRISSARNCFLMCLKKIRLSNALFIFPRITEGLVFSQIFQIFALHIASFTSPLQLFARNLLAEG